MAEYAPELIERFDAMMAAAGLSPSAAERAEMLEMYVEMKASVEAMYALPAAREESPALGFAATPPPPGWRSLTDEVRW